MKRSQVLAISVLALLLITAVPAQEAAAQGAYTEKLSVYVAGNDALWYFTFGGVNGSTKLAAFEGTAGLSWYNVTMASTSGWQPDFQVFGPKGYGLYPVPFISSQALFLTVGSDTFADASAAAANLDSYLLTSFRSLTNGTGVYAFYSPLSFNDIAPVTLLRFLPTGEGGFANAITKSGFESTASPFIILEGQKSASGFDHTLFVGSISSSALDSSSRPAILGYFGSGITSLAASTRSNSSEVQVKVLDGIMLSKDPAAVENDGSTFTSSYALSLASGKHLSRVNATVTQQPAPLLAYRTVDAGVLRTNDILAVTLNLKNLAPSETITKVAFSDTWWNKTGVFKLLPSSNYTVPTGGLSPGAAITPVYRLQYTGTGTGSIVIPASLVRYSYHAGSQTFNATVRLNSIRLSLGQDDAVVYTTVTPVGGLGKSVGMQQKLNVTAVNVGTLPASAVFIAGHSISGLAGRSGSSVGGSATVTVTVAAASMTRVNASGSFTTTYQDPGGSPLNASSNLIPVIFSHASMNLGDPALQVSAHLATLRNGETNLTLTFATSNPGRLNVTGFSASASLPAGLGCGAISGKAAGTKGFACSSGTLSIDYPLLNATSTLTAYMKYNLTTPMNYFLGPIRFNATTGGTSASGSSNPVAIPGGVVLKKQFAPAQLFGGMSATVVVSGTNSGPLPLYNASVTTTPDAFDALSGGSSLTKSAASLQPGGNLSFSYGVKTFQVSGNQTGTPVTAGFYFGGNSFSIQGAGPTVNVFQPLSVSITTHPTSPEEGKNFTITFRIINPTGVAVSNVQFTLPIPSGLGLSRLQNLQVNGGTLVLSAASLQAHSSVDGNATAVASSGITIPFDKAKLTFQYAGTSINGVTPSKSGIAIAEDVTTRYLIPTALIVIVVFAVAFYVRRKAAPTSPASPK